MYAAIVKASKDIRYVVGVLCAVCGVWVVSRRIRKYIYWGIGLYTAYRYIVAAAIVAIVGLYALMPVDAYAQTPTPTATPRPYYRGEYPSVFPGGYDEDAFWVCQGAGEGANSGAALAAMVGSPCVSLSWSNTGFGVVSNSFGFYSAVEDDSPIEYARNVMTFIAPRVVQTYTISCDFSATRYIHAGGGSTYTALHTTSWFENGALVADLGGGPPSFLGGATQVLESSQKVVSLLSPPSPVFGHWESVPNYSDWLANPAVGDGPVGVSSDIQATGQNNGLSRTMICVVADLMVGESDGGGEWVPPGIEPTPTPSGTSVAILPWPSPVSWVPITDTTNMPDMGISEPVSGTCQTIVPGIVIDPDELADDLPTGFGWLITLLPLPEINTTPVEWCTVEYDIGMRFLGVDLGASLLLVMGIGATAVLVSIVKRS